MVTFPHTLDRGNGWVVFILAAMQQRNRAEARKRRKIGDFGGVWCDGQNPAKRKLGWGHLRARDPCPSSRVFFPWEANLLATDDHVPLPHHGTRHTTRRVVSARYS